MSTYTVRAGDSLTSIARDQLGDANLWKQIASLNQLPSTLIRAGQTLQLPAAPIGPVTITQNYTPGYDPLGQPFVPSVRSVPGIDSPASMEEFGSPELVQEITVTGKRIDYTVVALILLAGWALFGSGRR